MQVFKPENQLTPCKYMFGFYKVPDENFSVHRDGRVFNHETQAVLAPSLHTSGDYKLYKQTDKRKLIRTIAYHVLIAKTFLDSGHIPDDRKAIVNHLNGNRGDNRVCNLEWTTFSGNITHAFKQGMRSDNIPLLCKNIHTGETFRFISYSDMAERLGVKRANIHTYMHRKTRNVFFAGMYLVIREGEEFPTESEYSRWLSKGHRVDWAVINTETKEVTIYNAKAQVAKHIGTTLSKFNIKWKEAESVGNLKVTNGIFMVTPFYALNDELRDGSLDLRKATNPNPIGRRRPQRIEVITLSTGEIEVCESLEIFASRLGVGKKTLARHIHRNNGVWKRLYRISYLREE